MEFLLSAISFAVKFGLFVGIPLYLCKARTKTAKNVAGGSLIFFGIAVSYFLLTHIVNLQIPSRWRNTQGEITQSSYTEWTEYYSRGAGRRSMPRLRTRTVFAPIISYTYVVNDARFISEKIGFRELRMGKLAAQKFVSRYPVGASVRVYFDPLVPNMSAIDDSGADASEIIWLMIFLGYVALGWYLIFVKQAKKPFPTAEELLVLSAETAAGKMSGQVASLSPTKTDVNALDAYGRTSLIRAVLSGESDKVQEYLEIKADVNVRDKDGKSALYYAKALGQNDVAHILKEAGGTE